MQALAIPEVDFRETDLADVIAFVADAANEYGQIVENRQLHVSPVLDLAERDQEQEKRDRKYARLKKYCGDKKITLNLRNCSLLTLLDFLTRYAGVKYEFEDNHVLIKTLDGDVLVKD